MDGTTLLGIVNVVASLVLVGLTAWYARSTKELVQASKPVPSVIIEMEFQKHGLMCIVIKNIGNAVAKGIRLNSATDIHSTNGKRLADLSAFKTGIPYLAPGAELSLYFDHAPAYFQDNKLEKSWAFDVSYSDMSSTSYGPYRFDIDLSIYENSLMDSDNLASLVNEFEKMNSSFRRIISDGTFGSTGIRIVTSTDIRRSLERVSQAKEEQLVEGAVDSVDAPVATMEHGDISSMEEENELQD